MCQTNLRLAQSGKVPLTSSQLLNFLFFSFSAAMLTACGGEPDTTTDTGHRASLVGIGFIAGHTASQALAVSADGSVVVGSSQPASGKLRAVRWSAQGGLLDLGLMPGGTFSSARAVSADGSVVVGDGDAQATARAVFRWRPSTGLMQLNSLANSNLCAAGGVSGDGDVVVGTCLTTNSSAFRWTDASGMVSLGQYGGGSDRTSNAANISMAGTVIVGAGHPVLNGAMFWNSSNVPNMLGYLPGDVSGSATATSRDGNVVVGYSVGTLGRMRIFRWTHVAGMMTAGPIPAGLSDVIPSAVSGNGQVIVGWGIASQGNDVALIWDELHGMRPLDTALQADYKTSLTGWTLQHATGISDDGNIIVGYGTNPSGQTEGWRISLIDPAPIKGPQ